MKLIGLFLFVLVFHQDQIPLKPKEDFDLKLDFEFKSRPTDNSLRLADGSIKPTSGPLPYLTINLRILNLDAEEVRVRISGNRGNNASSKKAEANMLIKMDMGFTDDLKDQVTANEYNIYFLSKDKKPISRIEILFQKDGTYLVNGEKRCKV